VKNATNASQGENYLLTNYYNIFVNPVADPEVGKELKKKIWITYIWEEISFSIWDKFEISLY
jgi:hypothetical protein